MKKSLPGWHITVQVSTLAFLVMLIVLPHVQAQITTPSSVPTSVDELRDHLPATPNADQLQQEGEAALNQQAQGLLNGREQDVPRNLRQVLDQGNTGAVTNNTQAYVQNQLTGELGQAFPNTDASRLAAGDITSVAGTGGETPEMLAHLASQVRERANDLEQQREDASYQALAVTGQMALADCADNDSGKDVCTGMKNLKDEIARTDDSVQRALRAANRLKLFVSNKPAFLNTPSMTTPVCLGLLTDAPGVTDQLPDIASNLPAYNDSENLLSVEAIRAQLLSSGDDNSSTSTREENTTTSNDPLADRLAASNAGASAYAAQIARMQNKYQELYARSLDNFGATIQERIDLAKTHADEMKQITSFIKSVATALNGHPQTP